MLCYDMIWSHNITQYEHIESLKRIGSNIFFILVILPTFDQVGSSFVRAWGRREWENPKPTNSTREAMFIVRLYCFMFWSHQMDFKQNMGKKNTPFLSCYPWVWLQNDGIMDPDPPRVSNFSPQVCFWWLRGSNFRPLEVFQKRSLRGAELRISFQPSRSGVPNVGSRPRDGELNLV